MKILHTSDWHIGKTLYGKRRYDEHQEFLRWLIELVRRENIDAVLVSGDIFDTATPSNTAQELYYGFLHEAARLPETAIIITAGNHDSPSFINAPKALLKSLDVHAIGPLPQDECEELIVLEKKTSGERAIVCAVPFLRERDVRAAEPGESIEDKDRKLAEGIRSHYERVCALAEKKRAELESEGRGRVPLIAMGHLFAAGGKVVENDGVRDLYVGSLGQVGADVFPKCIDYLALGHLHSPQTVGGEPLRRYSGSPMPMSFSEAERRKSVCIADFAGEDPVLELVPVPIFQELERIAGNRDAIETRLKELAASGSKAWLEIIYEGNELAGELRSWLDEAVAGTELEILRIKNSRLAQRAVAIIEEEQNLDELDEEQVFRLCLDENGVPDEQRPELIQAYGELCGSVYK